MGAYPWGFTGVTPNASDNIADQGSFTGKALQFTDDGALPGAPVHHYAALVAADQDPVAGEAAATGGDYRGPQPGTTCLATDGTSMPSACDDGPFGKGTGGQLRYAVTVPAGGSKTLWVAAAGSDKGLDAAKGELAGALEDPDGALAAKVAARDKLSKWSQVSLPGDRLLQDAIDWGKQNLADTTQTASDLQIRWTNQGKQFPPPLGTVAHARWFGAGYPDYPWIFATDGEYTNFAAVALGQFEIAKDHLRALRDISDVLNDRSGIVVHEAVSDGSIWFGHDSVNPDTKINDFNTDETVKFPSAVALIWRWTGDDRFRDEMYDFAKRNLQVVDRRLDVDHDGWPEGSGNVERTGMGPEKLDNGVYYIRSLYDLADMARSKHDRATEKWATGLARKLQRQFEGTWWDTGAQQYADSLVDPGNDQILPEALDRPGADGGRAEHRRRGDAGRRLAATTGPPRWRAGRTPASAASGPGSRGLFHTGCGGGPEGKGEFSIFSLTTSIQAVGEGNFGRLGPGQQQRYTRRQRRDDVLRARNGQHPRRAARRDAGDLPVGAQRRPQHRLHAEHHPLLDVPVDGHAGLGQLRHRVVGDPPAARGAALPQRRRSCRWCRRSRRTSPAWRARTSGSGAARSASSPRTRRPATRRRSMRRARRCAGSSSATRCRTAPSPRACGSTVGASSATTPARPTAGSR